jgi:hypothetical protein
VIPDSIKRTHILRALKALRTKNKIPARREAKKYDLLFKGKRYPPKYVVSLAHTFLSSRGRLLRGFKGGREANDFLSERGFKVVNSLNNGRRKKERLSRKENTQERSFWIVSPNVRNKNQTVSAWGEASVAVKAAFMGYPPAHGHKSIGFKFANIIRDNDIILIARRSRHKPEVVGCGVVKGGAKVHLKGFKTPQSFGSLRKLSPFVRINTVPSKIPILQALKHTRALRQLHPAQNNTHRIICEWLESTCARNARTKNSTASRSRIIDRTRLAGLFKEEKLEYEMRTRKKTKLAKKAEAELLIEYAEWLKARHRKLFIVWYKGRRCDAYEPGRRNLLEAKSSSKREHLRMAVGQLLDYSYLGKKQFGKPNMAVLLPARPTPDSELWLSGLHISVVWRERGAFLDNANRQFS